VFEKISGLILGRPQNNKYVEEYNNILLDIIRDEQGNDQLPIITEMDFGHTCPTNIQYFGKWRNGLIQKNGNRHTSLKRV